MFYGYLSSMNEMEIVAEVIAILSKIGKCSRKYIFYNTEFLLKCVCFLTLID